MSNDHDTTVGHYTQGTLLRSIERALGSLADKVTVTDLGPADEFHTGGRLATEYLAEKLDLVTDQTVLDVGCGIGGTSRFLTSRFGVNVHGIDLTREFVDTGNELNKWVGLTDQISLIHGNALSLPFPDNDFDAAVMLHVGMNIRDKPALFKQIFRCLKPGARFVLYDMMSLREQPAIEFPVPWASQPDISWVESSAAYSTQLAAAGFHVNDVEIRSAFARSFFLKMRETMSKADGPPPLGLHLVMGPDAATKIKNMADGVFAGEISPVQIVSVKPKA